MTCGIFRQHLVTVHDRFIDGLPTLNLSHSKVSLSMSEDKREKSKWSQKESAAKLHIQVPEVQAMFAECDVAAQTEETWDYIQRCMELNFVYQTISTLQDTTSSITWFTKASMEEQMINWYSIVPVCLMSSLWLVVMILWLQKVRTLNCLCFQSLSLLWSNCNTIHQPRIQHIVLMCLLQQSQGCYCSS